LFDPSHYELDDITGFVFELHGKILAAQDRRGVLERLQQFTGSDAVIDVFTDPGLQQTRDDLPHSSTAIHEIPLHAADLGDMKVRFDRFTIGP
jgi:hypothetical protein